MRALALAAVALSVLLSGCVRQERFRFVPVQSSCFTAEGPGAPQAAPDKLLPSLDCRHSLYSLAFIEFDSEGRAFDPAQEEAALRLIERTRAAAPGGKIITLIYVHGWKNNAAEAPPGGKPKDAERFQSALLELGYRSRKAAGGDSGRVPVVGVYMGWRGKSLMGPGWFTFLSYWSRRNTANLVGDGADFAPTLNRIIAKVNEGDTGSRIALIGHSFGARVLEHAIERRDEKNNRPQVQLYIEPTKSGATHVEPLVDLTLYVNSANDARLSLGRIKELQSSGLRVRHPDYDPAKCENAPPQPAVRDAEDVRRCRDYPLIVTITSHGDHATKYLQPFANILAPDRSVAKVDPPVGDYLDKPEPSAGRYARSAAGHMPFLYSHVVREISCPALPAAAGPSITGAAGENQLTGLVAKEVARALGRLDEVKRIEEEERAHNEREEQRARERGAELAERMEAALHPVCAPEDEECRFIFRTQGERPACFQVDQRSPVQGEKVTLRPFNSTPFWIMAVEPAVIRDHGDIWNLSFVEMLGQLLAPRGFFDPRSGRVQMRVQ
jgi:hypothetical protein